MNLFLITLFLLTFFYAVFIIWCIVGWNTLNEFQASAEKLKTVVSVIIPARNEAEKIIACLQDIMDQKYPPELFEIIVVDDCSDDTTAELVSEVIRRLPYRKISLLKNEDGVNGIRYKKQAITSAVQKAGGELIVTTDADCRFGENWLATLVSYYEMFHPLMIAGPVCFHREKNNFERIQCLEFIGLAGIGAAAISHQQPMMCNGANLAFTKNIFTEVNGFGGEPSTASGDDTQLLLKVAKRNPSGIHFLKSPDAIVYTRPMSSVKELFHQRKRWASKIPVTMSSFTILVGILAYAVHAGLLFTLVASLFIHSVIPFFLMLLFIKCIPEIIFLYHISGFFNGRKFLWLFLPAQLIYLVYITLIGAVSPFGSYRWKEREIKLLTRKVPAS